MSHAPQYADRDVFAIDAGLDERLAFIRRTYAHVFGAVVAFVAICAALINTPAIAEPMMNLMFHSWWLVLLAFMAAGWVARQMAYSGASQGAQYLGLAVYVVIEALIFTPLLYAVHTNPQLGGDTLIFHAGIVTLFIFAGLTAIVMLTRADFSFLRNVLLLGAIAAFALIFGSMFFGFNLGLYFVIGMVVLMCGYILYDTSQVLHHFRTDQHVAASLELFASLATLFWYILRLMSILRR